MRSAGHPGRFVLAALLGLALVVWSAMPGVSHASARFESPRSHAGMNVEHGHSHGVYSDPFTALHGHGQGHGHDAADHDHSEAMPSLDFGPDRADGYGDARGLPPSRRGPFRAFRIDRPPRA